MAALRGRVYSDKNTSVASRLGNAYMAAKLNTWQGGVRITLDNKNRFEVFCATDDPEDPRDLLIAGNAVTGEITHLHKNIVGIVAG